jgi:hypothetical protein
LILNNAILEIALWLAAFGVLAQLGCVARLVFGSRWIEPECRGCGYSMRGLPGDQKACPECGRVLTGLDRRGRLGWEKRQGRPSVFHPMMLWLAGCVLFFIALALLRPEGRAGYVTQSYIVPILVEGQPRANAVVTCQAPVQLLKLVGTYDVIRQGEPDLTRVMVRFSKHDFAQEAKVSRLYVMDLQEVRPVSGIATEKPKADPASLVRAMFTDAGLNADAGEEATVVELLQELRGEALNAQTGGHIPLVTFNQPRQVMRNTTRNMALSMLTPWLAWGPYAVLLLWLAAGWGVIALRVKTLVGEHGHENSHGL